MQNFLKIEHTRISKQGFIEVYKRVCHADGDHNHHVLEKPLPSRDLGPIDVDKFSVHGRNQDFRQKDDFVCLPHEVVSPHIVHMLPKTGTLKCCIGPLNPA